MKKYMLFLFCMWNFIVPACTQSANTTAQLTGNPAGDIDRLLSPGVYTPAVMHLNPSISQRQMELTAKVQKAMYKNKTWFTDTLPRLTGNDPELYAEKMGLTKEELAEMGNKKSALSYTLSYTTIDSLQIKKNNGVISFKGSGNLSVLDSLQIDLTGNTVLYKGFSLAYSKKTGQNIEETPYNMKRSGYLYSYIDGNDFTENGIPDIKKMTVNRFEFEIGQLTEGKQVIIIFNALQWENGKQKFARLLPFQF